MSPDSQHNNDELECTSIKTCGEEHSFPKNVELITWKRTCVSSAGADSNIVGRPEVPGDSISILSMKTKQVQCVEILSYFMGECISNCCLANLWHAKLSI